MLIRSRSKTRRSFEPIFEVLQGPPLFLRKAEPANFSFHVMNQRKDRHCQLTYFFSYNFDLKNMR